MERAVNPYSAPSLRSSRVWLMRARQLIGWAGLVGLALMAAAAAVFSLAWAARSDALAVVPASPAVEIASKLVQEDAARDGVEPFAPTGLGLRRDVLPLLGQMEQIAVSNGLGWPAADYRITAATETQPSSLEVRTSLKGPYPKVRSMLLQVLREVPASTFRELSMSRASSDSVDVEAKVVIAVLLEDEPVAPGQPQRAEK